MKVGVIGAGAFGTAIAQTVANNVEKVVLYLRREQLAKEINNSHYNTEYYPNTKLKDNIIATTNLDDLKMCEIIFLSIPSSAFRPTLESLKDIISKDILLVTTAKGIEYPSLKTMGSLIEEYFNNEYVALSGPNFASEIILNLPTVSNIASRNQKNAEKVKEILKDNVNEESKLEPKRRKRKEKIVELTPIEKLIEETKEEISNNPDQETETNINKEEKRLIIDFPNIQCNINDMFEQYMKVQMMQIELWNQQLKNSNRMIEQLLNKNEELQESVKELLLFNAKETKTNIEDGIDFGSYMKEAYKLANKVLNLEGGKEKYSNKYGVLSNAYKLLNKEYGIVWAQIEKDFKKEYERTPISTLETSWYLEQKEPVHKNILFAKLSNMYEQDKAM